MRYNMPMEKDCRFCRKGRLARLFSATNLGQKMEISNFACTNCGYGNHGPVVKCQNCGIIYIDEKLSQLKISSYYEGVDDPVYLLEQPARKKTFEGYLAPINVLKPRRGKMLDVGTNTGLFVKVAQKSGWNVSGLEPSRKAVDFAKKEYSLTLINKPFTKGLFKNNSFDVVTMWDVIEHFEDPIAQIKKVSSILKDGGVFAFTTVDPESFLAKMMGTRWSWYMEMHRVFFSIKTARYYLKQNGYTKIVIKPHWRYLSLKYFAGCLAAISPQLSKMLISIIEVLGLSEVIVPYWANDLYNCYAIKKTSKE